MTEPHQFPTTCEDCKKKESVPMYACADHEEIICPDCVIKIHYNCEVSNLISSKEVYKNLKFTESIIKEVQMISKRNKTSKYVHGAKKVVSEIMDDLSSICESTKQAISQGLLFKLPTINKSINKLKLSLPKNPQVSELLFAHLIQNLHRSSSRSKHSSSRPKKRTSSNTKKGPKMVTLAVPEDPEYADQNMEETIKNSPEFKEIMKKLKAEYLSKLKSRYEDKQQPVTKVRFSEDFESVAIMTEAESTKLEHKSIQADSLDSLEENPDEIKTQFETELQQLKDTVAQIESEKANFAQENQNLNAKLAEMEERVQEYEKQLIEYKEQQSQQAQEEEEQKEIMTPNRESCENYYAKITGKKASFNKKFKLELSLNNMSGRKIIDVFSLAKLKIPDIKRVCLDNLLDNDPKLKTFLENCIPDNLQLLCLIFGSYFGDEALTKASFYSDGLKFALSKVSREAYIRHMHLETNDLELIIKASSQCERLLIHYCKVITQKDMNLALDPSCKYKITYLSFYFCGYDADVTMKWEENPERLEWLLESISKCSLKDSLKQINVGWCNIGTVKTQELLEKHGLGHIKAIEESPVPIND